MLLLKFLTSWAVGYRIETERDSDGFRYRLNQCDNFCGRCFFFRQIVSLTG